MPMLERQVAPVPGSTFSQPGIGAAQKWVADYNVSCWLRARAQFSSTVTLAVRYCDATGERQAEVDRAGFQKEGSLLLSGRVSLSATGPIESMTVWLLSEPACELQVDELYLQRVGSPAASKPLIAAR